jgi:hypothetical protein
MNGTEKEIIIDVSLEKERVFNEYEADTIKCYLFASLEKCLKEEFDNRIVRSEIKFNQDMPRLKDEVD